jgi:hypothetical protein
MVSLLAVPSFGGINGLRWQTQLSTAIDANEHLAR